VFFGGFPGLKSFEKRTDEYPKINCCKPFTIGINIIIINLQQKPEYQNIMARKLEVKLSYKPFTGTTPQFTEVPLPHLLLQIINH
jgi:hypothetical protein